jgi:DNA modification methylase
MANNSAGALTLAGGGHSVTSNLSNRPVKRASVLGDAEVRRALRQLAGANPKGQQHEVRWVHPFAARMPLSVADHLVREISTPSAVVLDPMVGSGTTVVAARQLGRRAFGIDRDPLALLISRVAATTFELKEILRLSERVRDRARRLQAKRRAALKPVSEETQRFIEYWFPLESQRQLAGLAEAIRDEPAGARRDLAWLVFSSLIIAKSAGASWAMDISRSRPHKREDKDAVLPFDAWHQRWATVAARLPLRGNSTPEACVLGGDARALPLESDTVDMVLTSPPYLAAIDYLRAHRFSLVWMGHSMEAIRQLRATMVGTERGLWSRDGLPPSVEAQLERTVAPERLRAQRRQYLSDLKKVLAEAARVLRPQGLAIIAVGPRILSLSCDDAAPVVEVLARSSGLTKVGSVTRRLRAAERSLPCGGRGVGEALSRRMGAEVFVALRKSS